MRGREGIYNITYILPDGREFIERNGIPIELMDGVPLENPVEFEGKYYVISEIVDNSDMYNPVYKVIEYKKKVPPEGIVTHPVVVDNNYNHNIGKWIFQGTYYECPHFLECTHKGEAKISEVILNRIASDDEKYGVGKCETCGRILWLEVKNS